MVTTRSKTAQSHIEDYATNASSTPKSKSSKTAATQKSPPKANTSKKRKSTDDTSTSATSQPAKRAKTTKSATSPKPVDSKPNNSKIIINRAPVLHLWSACVTHVVHPGLSWSTCLSAGAAVSAICAVAKGRAIGTIPEKGDDSTSKTKSEKKDEDSEEIRVMQFILHIKDGLVVVGGKEKMGDEEGVRKKFAGESYGVVKGVFEDVLSAWKGGEDELNEKGFGMYERFRPEVKSGTKGRGRKGELNLERVEQVVGR